MAVQYKPGVSGTPTAPIQTAISKADAIYTTWGVSVLVVTSLRDGKHSAGSLHYSGNAVDLRRWDLDARKITSQVVSQLKSQLGSDYDVILESDHIHVEYDPKGQAASGSTPSTSPGSTDASGSAASSQSLSKTGISLIIWIFLILGFVIVIRR